jgi:heme-degrading monooxygenase HmoA
LFVTLWEFEVKRGSEELFERLYGPGGAWARLFRRDPRYRGTRLLRDSARPVYVTIDFWESREAHEEFQRAHAADYDALDRECQSLTASETKIAAFASEAPDRGGEAHRLF